MGITTGLGTLSHIVLIILMYGGRIGGFSLMLVLGESKKKPPTKRPTEKILIG
jgi:trk system potassium uptake protein TrkH